MKTFIISAMLASSVFAQSFLCVPISILKDNGTSYKLSKKEQKEIGLMKFSIEDHVLTDAENEKLTYVLTQDGTDFYSNDKFLIGVKTEVIDDETYAWAFTKDLKKNWMFKSACKETGK